MRWIPTGRRDGTIATVDAKPACKRQLLVQRGGLFDSPQLVVVDAVTFDEKVISNGVDYDFEGAWSPDGTRIAFTRNERSIWIADADGQNAHQLVSDLTNFLVGAMWSADGTRVAYVSSDPGGGGVDMIYTADANGTTSIPLVSGMGSDAPFAWSTNGNAVAFVSTNQGNQDVWTATPGGGGPSDVTNRTGKDGVTAVQWIDGDASILFDAGHVWTMNRDGSNQQNLTGSSGTETQPVWNATTNKIYFVRDSQIYVMNRNGAGLHQVSDGTLNSDPAPSGDGTQLAFTSGRDQTGKTSVYVSGANGEAPTKASTGNDYLPRWRPCD